MIASQPPLAPALTVSEMSMPDWAPKPTLTDCRVRSVIMASSAETAGSFMHSMIASTSASLSASRICRTATRVMAVVARDAALERPKVTTEAAAAAMICTARAMSWTMTATLQLTTRMAAPRSAAPMIVAACEAFWRYPSPPLSNLSYVFLNLSMASPALFAMTVEALLLALAWSSATSDANFSQTSALWTSLSSSAVGQVKPSISSTHSSSSGNIIDTAAHPRIPATVHRGPPSHQGQNEANGSQTLPSPPGYGGA
uniref:hypothetical protein n=1 Tax=Streptomyces boluensis TaxID=1775135 RepID=UPI001CB6C8C2|nr:hypothetical protein [Streptomyces boluensis]